MNRVVITGIGVVTPIGSTREKFWSSLVEARSGIGPITIVPTERLNTRIAAQVLDFNPADHFEPKRQGLLDRFSQFAVVAARAAVQDAQLQINQTGTGSENVQAEDKFEDLVNAADPIILGNPVNQPLSGGTLNSQDAVVLAAGSVVRGYTGTQVFDTRGSLSDNEVICGIIGGASEWISFVPQQSGLFYLNTDGSSYDTVMAVFTRIGTNTALTQLACDNNSGLDGIDSALSVQVTAGQTNYVVLDGVNGATGILQLNYSLVTATALQSLGQNAQGANLVRLVGHAGMKFTIQASSDMRQWSSLITTNSANDTFDYTDTGSTNYPLRYYRALMQP